jgi:sRNA-binding regulator protein Hfq
MGGNQAMIAQEQEPRNFRNPDPLNCSLEGRAVTVSLLNGRIESGKVKVMGQYSMLLELPNKREMIINKSGILIVSVL